MNILPSTNGVLFDRLSPDDWSRELREFEDASVYQTAAHGLVRSGERKLCRGTLVENGRIVGMAQVRLATIPLVSAGIAYVGWGPVWRRRSEDVVEARLARMLGALRSEFVDKRNQYLRIFPNVLASDPWAPQVLSIFKSEGFSAVERPDRTLVVDLRPSVDEMRKGLRKKWRYELGVAEKKNMQMTQGTTEELLDRALVLYHEMHERKKFAEFVDVADLRRMQELLDDGSKLRIMICSLDGEPLAAIVYALVGSTGLALMAATSTKALKTNASYLAWWNMLCELKTRGAVRCDLGGISPEHNPGGYVFKSGMAQAPESDVRYLGQFEMCRTPSTRMLISVAERLRTIVAQTRSRLKSLKPVRHDGSENS